MFGASFFVDPSAEQETIDIVNKTQHKIDANESALKQSIHRPYFESEEEGEITSNNGDDSEASNLSSEDLISAYFKAIIRENKFNYIQPQRSTSLLVESRENSLYRPKKKINTYNYGEFLTLELKW